MIFARSVSGTERTGAKIDVRCERKADVNESMEPVSIGKYAQNDAR